MSSPPAPRWPDPWLCLALAVAAALRFTGIDWGARHRLIGDEASFVEAVAQMLARGDLDHRFYEYPGLFLYLLMPGQWLVGGGDGFTATVAGRVTVAGVGVACVLLVYLLARALVGPAAALLAAWLKALSPLDVETAHMIRTDVVLEAGFLLGLLALVVPLQAAHRDRAAGVALGLSCAIKFSGPLLAASIAASAWARRRRSPTSGLFRCVGWAALVFTLCSPYTLLNRDQAVAGAGVQMRYHYEGRSEAPGYLENLAVYGGRLVETLGVPWLALAAVAIGVGRHRRRLWPLFALPVAVLLVFATAEVRYDRFLVPTTGVLAVLAAVGARHLARGHEFRLAALGLLSSAWPAAHSSLDVRSYLQPSTRDRAQDAIAAWVGPGQRVLNTCRELGAGPAGVSMTRARSLDPWTRRLAREHDLVIALASHVVEPLRHLKEVQRFRPTRATAGQGPELVLLMPRVPPAMAYEWYDLL